MERDSPARRHPRHYRQSHCRAQRSGRHQNRRDWLLLRWYVALPMSPNLYTQFYLGRYAVFVATDNLVQVCAISHPGRMALPETLEVCFFFALRIRAPVDSVNASRNTRLNRPRHSSSTAAPTTRRSHMRLKRRPTQSSERAGSRLGTNASISRGASTALRCAGISTIQRSRPGKKARLKLVWIGSSSTCNNFAYLYSGSRISHLTAWTRRTLFQTDSNKSSRWCDV
jgi:hypothetical protein